MKQTDTPATHEAGQHLHHRAGDRAKVNWQEETARRLEEAAALRKEMAQCLEIVLEESGWDPEHEQLRKQLLDRLSKERARFEMEWIRSPAALEPDPRTGRSNEEWRRLQRQEALRNNAKLAALREELDALRYIRALDTSIEF